jgi:transposase
MAQGASGGGYRRVQGRGGQAAPESGKALQQVAAELGSATSSGQRRRGDGSPIVAERARQKAEAAELARLKRENKRLEQENEILKRAAAFFAREAVPT